MDNVTADRLCQCGCGQPTFVAARTRPGRGVIKGQPLRFLPGHHQRYHGEATRGQETPEYRAWITMISRCHNEKHGSWGRYGARGITVCDHWRRSYVAFDFWMGSRPGQGYSVDRINNDGNYEPGNVRWATAKEQRANQRKTVART